VRVRFAGRIAVGVVLALLLLLAQTGFGHSVLRAAGVARPTEGFVELYFPDARTLPSSLPASGRLKIRFAVGNFGSTTRSLVWRVSENTGLAEVRLAAGRTVVAASRTVVVAQTVRIACLRHRAQLLISLKRSSARITLWLACPRRP